MSVARAYTPRENSGGNFCGHQPDAPRLELVKPTTDKIRPKIDKWNKAPRFVMFLAGGFGIPPLYILGFIARPLMGLGIVSFTLIVLGTRFARFVVLAAIPLLL